MRFLSIFIGALLIQVLIAFPEHWRLRRGFYEDDVHNEHDGVAVDVIIEDITNDTHSNTVAAHRIRRHYPAVRGFHY